MSWCLSECQEPLYIMINSEESHSRMVQALFASCEVVPVESERSNFNIVCIVASLDILCIVKTDSELKEVQKVNSPRPRTYSMAR